MHVDTASLLEPPFEPLAACTSNTVVLRILYSLDKQYSLYFATPVLYRCCKVPTFMYFLLSFQRFTSHKLQVSL